MEQKTTATEKQESKKPFYTKWWFWIIIGIVVIAIVGLSVGPLADDEKGDINNNNGNLKHYYIGDKVTVGNLEYTVNSIYDTQILGTALLGEQTQNNFIVISLTVKNIGNSEVTLTSANFEVLKGSAKYSVHSGSIYLTNGFYLMQSIGAGITTTIELAYEVPDLSTTTEYTLQVSQSYHKEIIILSQGK